MHFSDSCTLSVEDKLKHVILHDLEHRKHEREIPFVCGISLSYIFMYGLWRFSLNATIINANTYYYLTIVASTAKSSVSLKFTTKK